jgi:hypothetical protein
MAQARNHDVIDDVNRGNSVSRHVSIMTPLSADSDYSNLDYEGEISGEKL